MNRFPSQRIFFNKKAGNQKTKTNKYTTFKTDIIKEVLVFFDFQLFYYLTKIPREGNGVQKKDTYLR